MAYAVVTFDDDLVSEVPTNMKNVPSLISKRTDPDIQTWQLLTVNIEKYCASLDKARKIADDKNYTSCEESQLGKGCRTKIPNKQIYSDDDSEEDKENEKNKQVKTKRNKRLNQQIHKDSSGSDNNSNNYNKEGIGKKTQLKLPQWPDINNQVDEAISLQLNESSNENNDDESERDCRRDHSPSKHSPSYRSLERSPMSSQIKTNQLENMIYNMRKIKEEVRKIKNDVMPLVRRTDENVQTLMRMAAASDIHFTNIQQRIDDITPGVLPPVSTDRITKCLPLKTIDEIRQMESILELKNEGESFVNEYKTFIKRIGGHTLREIVKNALSQVFTNECALQCSWKGRKDNFGVAPLCIIKHIRDVVLDMHTNYTQKEFDEAASDWLRFAKQRLTRQTRINNE
ncbi:uncharacterized protein LOC114255275 [Monomorium pharaonis]|uniref:uncharacterized protein LOC114255275 n=1 Tax=Monomorium pharaonis TaxID=307658 RepID=UPI0017472F56|nr:uncharacterized protein LOC114255275 [Monomorium pharaonis]XP_036144341.1 uncharacterized protein LOC114255275 [Monomorium pharaonis]